MSPTVMRIGSFRFFFYSGDRGEPPHVHVERDDKVAKVWLEPIRLEHNGGFRPAELREILRLVEEHRETLLERWNEYFNS